MLRALRFQIPTAKLFTKSQRFASTLTFIETSKDGNLVSSSLNALTAAAQLGNPIHAVILGSHASTAANILKSSVQCEKLTKILVSDNIGFDHYLPEKVAPLFAHLLKNDEYSHFVSASSTVGKTNLPRLGALLDLQPINDIIKILDSRTFSRPIYAGNAIATVQCSQPKKLISIRASAFEPITQGSTDSAVIEEIQQIEPETFIDVKWEGETLMKSERPELGSASRVVTGGRALKDKETFEKILVPLADVLNAGIGATRAAVDNGFCDNSLQVGQTGKVVAPDLYVAIGVSGAIQHLAGMKDSKVIVAINNDPEAPVFKVADYSLEGDAYEVVPELVRRLKEM
ncbi:electron transfer flavoprotein alpha-subunit [Zygosaccharomyces mellis]|uniref:Probable electron transfer flavoprotein subunit alpha n=1 Tax=Zygosaccharomyces mellis TaxID=42258 RepID=A0A4C2E7X0_9SACH|nr:electron transfer flavoprotein alpha-subunit [Zygosaccharomyces mellis]